MSPSSAAEREPLLRKDPSPDRRSVEDASPSSSSTLTEYSHPIEAGGENHEVGALNLDFKLFSSLFVDSIPGERRIL